MRRFLALLLSMLFIISLSGCGNDASSNGKKTIVCTIFPQYNWVMEILGDKADEFNVILLLDNGTDLHSFQPGANDIITISTCDLFIYTGGISDTWVKETISTAKNENLISLNMMDIIGDLAVVEETIEGMQSDAHTHEHDGEDCDDDCDEHNTHEVEYDEHIWLSLKNASVICDEIYSALCKISPENKDDLTLNYETYIENLSSLEKEYSDTVTNAKRKLLLFGDRFPFRYMTEDYGLDYYAAFSGCSSETEASFNTIIFLANKVNEFDLPVVCVTESSNKSVANSIISSTDAGNQNIVVFDSIQSITKKQIEDGISYLEIMKANLDSLKKALN